MRTILVVAAIALGVIALLLGAGYVATLPATLKVAVPNHDNASRRMFEAASEHFRAQKMQVRLRVVNASDGNAALAALEKGDVDLVVARAEEVMRSKAQSLLILRQEAAVIIAPKTGKVKKFADIIGANVGVVREGPASAGAFAALMSYYALDPSKIRPQILARGDIGTALRDKKVDVAIIIGEPASKSVADAVGDAARNVKGGIKFLEIEAAEAIARRVPELESVEFKQGIFGGAPPLPSESVTSIGSTVRLVASERLTDERGSDLLRQLLAARQTLGAVVPSARRIKVPDDDESVVFVKHSAVVAYGDGEVKTFFDRYGDWVYMLLFLGSGVGSAFAGAFGWLNSQRRQRTLEKANEIGRLAEAASTAASLQELDAVEAQVNEIFAFALAEAVREKLDESNIATFQLALSQAQGRIERRRLALQPAPAPAAAAETAPVTAGEPTEAGQLITFKPVVAVNPNAS